MTGRPPAAVPRRSGLAALAAAATPVVAAALVAVALVATGCRARPPAPTSAAPGPSEGTSGPRTPAAPPSGPSGSGAAPPGQAARLLVVLGGPARPRAVVHDVAFPDAPGVPVGLPDPGGDGGLATIAAARNGRLAAIYLDGSAWVAPPLDRGDPGHPGWAPLPGVHPGWAPLPGVHPGWAPLPGVHPGWAPLPGVHPGWAPLPGVHPGWAQLPGVHPRWTPLPGVPPRRDLPGPVLGGTWSDDGSALILVAGAPGSGSRRTAIVTVPVSGSPPARVEVPLEADGPAIAALPGGIVAFVGRDLRDRGALVRTTPSGSFATLPVAARAVVAGGGLVAIVDDSAVRVGTIDDLGRGVIPVTPLPLEGPGGIGAVGISGDGTAVAVVRLDDEGTATAVEVLRRAGSGWAFATTLPVDQRDGTAGVAWLP